MFDRILVPQGAEAAAVKRGLKRAQASTVILPIAMGPQATARRLTTALDSGGLPPGSKVLVLGVAGSLSAQLGIGDVVVYEKFIALSPSSKSLAVIANREGTAQVYDSVLRSRLPEAQVITALSSDRLIHSTQEKAQLQASTGAQAVDMEAAAIQTSLSPRDIQISTVRVISDDLGMDLPNIEGAINDDGGLDGVKMAMVMVSQPKAAINLIRGSLKALKVLEDVTYRILES